MAVISTKLVQLKRQLARANAREEYRRQELQRRIDENIVTPYEGRGDLTDYYVQSFTDPDLWILVSVPDESIVKCLGGIDATTLAKVGGQLAEPTGAIAGQRGNANLYMSLKFIHRDVTPTATLTKWGTRVVKYYNKSGDQAFRQIPIGGATVKAIVAAYNAIVATPAPFSKGEIQLLGGDNSIIRSRTIN